MPIHYTNPKCDICGERHAADHPIECRDGLAAEVVLKREELADAEADLTQEREKNESLETLIETLRLHVRVLGKALDAACTPPAPSGIEAPLGKIVCKGCTIAEAAPAQPQRHEAKGATP